MTSTMVDGQGLLTEIPVRRSISAPSGFATLNFTRRFSLSGRRSPVPTESSVESVISTLTTAQSMLIVRGQNEDIDTFLRIGEQQFISVSDHEHGRLSLEGFTIHGSNRSAILIIPQPTADIDSLIASVEREVGTSISKTSIKVPKDDVAALVTHRRNASLAAASSTDIDQLLAVGEKPRRTSKATTAPMGIGDSKSALQICHVVILKETDDVDHIIRLGEERDEEPVADIENLIHVGQAGVPLRLSHKSAHLHQKSNSFVDQLLPLTGDARDLDSLLEMGNAMPQQPQPTGASISATITRRTRRHTMSGPRPTISPPPQGTMTRIRTALGLNRPLSQNVEEIDVLAAPNVDIDTFVDLGSDWTTNHGRLPIIKRRSNTLTNANERLMDSHESINSNASSTTRRRSFIFNFLHPANNLLPVPGQGTHGRSRSHEPQIDRRILDEPQPPCDIDSLVAISIQAIPNAS